MPWHAGYHTLLHGRIVFQRAMPIQVVLAHVEENANGRIERGREINLVGRRFDHMGAPAARRRERENGGTNIAAHFRLASGVAQHMRKERSRGGLPVRAGDRHKR